MNKTPRFIEHATLLSFRKYMRIPAWWRREKKNWRHFLIKEFNIPYFRTTVETKSPLFRKLDILESSCKNPEEPERWLHPKRSACPLSLSKLMSNWKRTFVLRAQHDILRFQVAVNNAVISNEHHAAEDLRRKSEHEINAQCWLDRKINIWFAEAFRKRKARTVSYSTPRLTRGWGNTFSFLRMKPSKHTGDCAWKAWQNDRVAASF